MWAGITRGLPDLKLRAVRSATLTGVKVPKPRITTTSPLASASLITLSVPSMAFTVVERCSFSDTDTSRANSFFVMIDKIEFIMFLLYCFRLS